MKLASTWTKERISTAISRGNANITGKVIIDSVMRYEDREAMISSYF